LLAGQPLNAQDALRIGLIEAVVAPDELLDVAISELRTTVAASRELVVRTKATMRLALQSTHVAACEHEAAEQKWSLGQPGLATALARLQKP